MGKPKNEQKFAEMGREDYSSQASYDVDMCSIEGQTREKDVFIRIEQSRENILKKSILKVNENGIKELERQIVEARPTLSEITVTELKEAVELKFKWYAKRKLPIPLSQADLEIILFYDCIQLNLNGYKWRMLTDGTFWLYQGSQFKLTVTLSNGDYNIPLGIHEYSDVNYTYQGLVAGYDGDRNLKKTRGYIASYNVFFGCVPDWYNSNEKGFDHNWDQAFGIGPNFAKFGFEFYKDNFPDEYERNKLKIF